MRIKKERVLTRKDYSKPDKSSLKKGNILPIYGNFTEGKDFRGNAELIERRPSSWRDEKNGFVRVIIKDEATSREGFGIIWKSQRWVVKYVDGQYKGHTTCANIGYFHSYSFLHKKKEE